MKKGFTLVELSIVLVIIGLLIGGILVAQSMIETAKIQSFVRQIDQLDAAMRNFKTKYNSLPGDTKFFAGTGNGDGLISGFGSSTITDGSGSRTIQQGFGLENGNVFEHLKESGVEFKDLPNPQSDATAGVRIGQHIPSTDFKGTGIIVSSLGEGPTVPTIVRRNAYFIADYNSGTDNNFSNGLGKLTGAQTVAIDLKMDDGVGSTGSVLIFSNFSGQQKMMYPFQGGAWTCTVTSVDCGLVINMKGDKT